MLLAGPSSSWQDHQRQPIWRYSSGSGANSLYSFPWMITTGTGIPSPRGPTGSWIWSISTPSTPTCFVSTFGASSGAEVQLPRFDFLTGRRTDTGKTLELDGGRHYYCGRTPRPEPGFASKGCGEALDFPHVCQRPPALESGQSQPDSHQLPPPSAADCRDYETRGASVSHTLAMWDSVRRGGAVDFPYQEHADVISTALCSMSWRC